MIEAFRNNSSRRANKNKTLKIKNILHKRAKTLNISTRETIKEKQAE